MFYEQYKERNLWSIASFDVAIEQCVLTLHFLYIDLNSDFYPFFVNDQVP